MISLLIASVGIYFLYLGWRKKSERDRQILVNEKVFGQVVGYEERASLSREIGTAKLPLQFPQLNFTTQKGQTVETTSLYGKTSKSYQIGQQVEIFYDPHNPQNAEIVGDYAPIFLHLAMMIIGGCLAVFGLFAAIIEFILYFVFFFAAK